MFRHSAIYTVPLQHSVRIWDPTMRFCKKIYVVLDLFSLRAWGWHSEGRNMSSWWYTILKYMKLIVVLQT